MSIREIRDHVRAAIEKSIEDSYGAFVQSQTQWLVDQAQRIAAEIAPQQPLYEFLKKSGRKNWFSTFSRLLISEGIHHLNVKLKPDYARVAERMARTEADGAKEHFISKNTMKLENIIANKQLYGVGGMDIEPIKADARRGTFEGSVRIVFDDGTGFIVRNQLVWKVSPLGRPFYQYPTTFHDVMVGPDEMRAMMSESEMLEWSDPDHKGKRISKIEEVSRVVG